MGTRFLLPEPSSSFIHPHSRTMIALPNPFGQYGLASSLVSMLPRNGSTGLQVDAIETSMRLRPVRFCVSCAR